MLRLVQRPFSGFSGYRAGVAQAEFELQALGAGAAENFTVVVLPDTQFYSESYTGIFDNQTQWIVNEQKNLNVVFVTHEGDIVNQKCWLSGRTRIGA